MTIQTDDGGTVNLRAEVDAGHPVTHDATGGRLLPTTKLSVEAAPQEHRREKPTKGGRSRWLWTPIVLALYIGARGLLGGGDWQDAGSNGGRPNGIQFQVPALPLPTFPPGFFDSLMGTPTPDPSTDIAEQNN